ncbi:MAG: hypothetical protein GY718_14430 [Lentisphaerae bacterium]|nr:hypothetical protein [Lentisphaerota bacterium]
MEFKEFKDLFQNHVAEMLRQHNVLFVTDTDKYKLWDTYLESFPPGMNEIYRERREFDCSCCKQFIRSFGNVVAIDKNQVVSIWDFETGDATYQPVINALSAFIKSAPVKDVFVTKESGFGTDKNYEKREDGSVHTWEHFRIDLPQQFVTRSSKSEASLMAEYRAVKDVFKRSLNEFTEDSIETVLDLIAQKSLYKGEEWQGVLIKFLKLHRAYHSLPDSEKDNYCWKTSVEIGPAVGKIRNHSIGVLLTDIATGMELNEAVHKYEAIVAPTNYKRPKAIFTKRMIEQAQQTITDLGFLDSLGRRFATTDDITVNNVLFANKDTLKLISGNVFEDLQSQAVSNPRQFDRIEEIPAEQFIKDILPRLTSLEIMLENKHIPNLVSVIAPQVKAAPTMFKWDNGFSWAYNGNITDSMKQRVKAAGGNVEGILRFSIQWNESNDNQNDFDAHCIEPNGNHIWFKNKARRHPSTGMLDVDIIDPLSEVAVENITWTDINKMQEGVYTFHVNNYSHCGGRSGFSAEIEYDGQIHSYGYNKELRQDENVIVAKVDFSRKNGIKFMESLPSSTSSRTEWGMQTNQFCPVSMCMFSPNYWDEQMGIGHRHYFFILKGCQNDTQPNGFFNEFLRENLLQHKRVFEALGSKMRVEPSENQLSGLGFSATKHDSLVCKIEGHINRAIKITF